jgi:hypothetical protein
MLKHYCLIPAFVILLAFLNFVTGQEPSITELARGSWIAEYEGNVMEVQRIERCLEYQPHCENNWIARGEKIKAPTRSEVAILYLRTERVTAKIGFGSRHASLASVEGKEYESGTVAIGGPGESRFDRVEHFYEIPIVVPEGTRFERVVLFRERYDPRRREGIIIDMPGGA